MATTVCSLSLQPSIEYPSQPCQPPDSASGSAHYSASAAPAYLTITRCHGNSCPLLLHISIPQESVQLSATCAGQTQLLIRGSSGSTVLHAPIQTTQAACQAPVHAVREFESILADSAASMKADVAPMTSADKTAWWRQRMALDQRMADLLKHLDLAWLGPWR